jgi:hypothetical protein
VAVRAAGAVLYTCNVIRPGSLTAAGSFLRIEALWPGHLRSRLGRALSLLAGKFGEYKPM